MFDKRAAGKSIHFSTGQTNTLDLREASDCSYLSYKCLTELWPQNLTRTLHKFLFPEASPTHPSTNRLGALAFIISD